jgi:hypothetical protein
VAIVCVHKGKNQLLQLEMDDDEVDSAMSSIHYHPDLLLHQPQTLLVTVVRSHCTIVDHEEMLR